VLATIGYERATLVDFIATLKLVGVEVLYDIREKAQSRRPGFSKTALSEALAAAGIDYVHRPELGDPKAGREAARSGNYKLFREVFSEVMNTSKANLALWEIESIAAKKYVCLMCFERNQNECHRKIVSDFIDNKLGMKAKHLGVVEGAAIDSTKRRMLHSDQGVTASL
jgi:uncharacterized protein (DUF488 family)